MHNGKRIKPVTAIRLTLALEDGGLDLPEHGRIAVFGPRAGTDFSVLPRDLCHVITGFRPDYDFFAGQGFTCNTAPEGRYAMSIVCIPRARDAARAMIAWAIDVTDGPVVIDGQKTDGIESALRECRKRVSPSAPISKAHGKLFWFTSAPEFSDWHAGPPKEIEDGLVTAPGVFSADGIDPASRHLADHLPKKMGGHVIDLGAGWGYLSSRILHHEKIAQIDLVEADHAALACAKQNVIDKRARFHWEDATRWRPDAPVDMILMNPPFHNERKAEPAIGRAFIQAAAQMLKPSGQLWMVANRHLPYESILATCFGDATEVAGDKRFKLFHARRPSRHSR